RLASRLARCSACECTSEIRALLCAECIWGERHEERRAALGKQVEPLSIERPRNVVRHAHAIGVGGVERVMLSTAEGERVDAHLSRACPVGATGIVADPAQLE